MVSYAFPRENRILCSRDYDKVFKNPIRVSAPGLLILGIKNHDIGHARLGLVVPKKVLKRAVRRNRIKRLVRESFRLNQNAIPEADLVFMAKPRIDEMDNTELAATLTKLWEQISRRLKKLP